MLRPLARKPFAGLPAEVPVRTDHFRVRKLQCVMVDRRRSAHDCVKCWSISVGWPHFKAILRLPTKWFGVHDERLNAHRRCIRVHGDQFRMKRVEEKLQRGQPLLPVDDCTLLHGSNRVLHLLEHDGT